MAFRLSNIHKRETISMNKWRGFHIGLALMLVMMLVLSACGE